MTVVLECENLTKVYPGAGRPAVDAVDLALRSGRVLAVLGANGAGKTTLLRMLTTLTRPSEGSAAIAGHDIRTEGDHARHRIGLVGQYAALDDVLSGRQNLVLVGRLLGLGRARAEERAEELLVAMDLLEAGDRPVAGYSGGMRRRIDLAVALIARPELLFIDEPTTGLDPLARRALWAEVRALVAEGTAVVLTTQYLEEADELADDVVMLREGKVVLAGSADELRRLAGPPRTVTRPPSLEDVYLSLHEPHAGEGR